MRILHVCRTGWPHRGGMESVLGGLTSALARLGHTVMVVTLAEAPNGEALRDGVWGGVMYRRLQRVGPRRYPMALGLRPLLRAADVVHVHGVDGLLHQVLAHRPALRYRVGLTPHGAFLHTSRNWILKQAWLRTGAARALASADLVWFTSEHERRLLAPTGVSGTVIGNGVDTERFSRLIRTPEEGRWLVFGRLDVHKGLHLLLDRLAAVAEHDPRVFQLRVVGEEAKVGLRLGLQEHAFRLGISHRIRFLGGVSQEELVGELARCELALFPSQAEAFGVGVVEAQAAGVPVVVQDIPPFRELVSDRVDGFVVDFRSGEASRILRALRGAGHRVSDAARSAARRHSWSHRAVAWEAEYRGLVS